MQRLIFERVCDVSLQGSGVNSNPSGSNGAGLDQMLVEIGNPLLAESLVEVDKGGSIGNTVHE